MRRLAGISILGLALAAQAVAGVGVWTPVGGSEPPYSQLLVDSGDPETLYALVVGREPESAGAIWKSTDGGATWRPPGQGLGPVDLLAVDPLRPGRLYAWNVSVSALRTLQVSEDGGESWTVRYTAPADGSGPYFFWQIVASPLREGVLYAWNDAPATSGGNASLYRSADGGATWTSRGEVGSISNRSSITALSHHPARNRLEFFDHAAFYTSDDNGLTWTVRGTFRGHGFSYVTRSAAAPDRLYALPSALDAPCLVRSDDGGTRWNKTRSRPRFPGSLYCTGLAVDPRNPDLVRVTAEGLVGRNFVTLISTSRDGGVTWSRPRSFPSRFPLSAETDPETLFATGGNSYYGPGPYKSTDDGLTWTPSWEGIAAGDLRGGLAALATSGPDPLLVAVGHTPGIGGGQIVRSVDGGATWQAAELPGEYLSLAADADGRTLYAVRFDTGRVVKSTDGGRSWVATARVSTFLGGLLADPFQPGRVFASAYDSVVEPRVTVSRTADAGRSWARRSAGLPVTCSHVASVDICPDLAAVTSDPRNPDRVVISFGGDGGFFSPDPHIFVSTNGGTRWRRAAQGPPALALSLAADPGTPGVFLAGTRQGIYRSADGGDHWTRVEPGLPAAAPVTQLLRDGHTGVWYAVTDGGGIFRSADGGSTWAGISEGLPDLARPRVVIDPQTPGRLFAAVRGQGLWSWSAPGD